MTKCLNCNNEFKAKRTDQRFCSTKCRVAFSRNITRNTVTTSVPNDVTSNWVPNWKRNGYKSRKAVDKALMGIIEQFPTCKWMFKGYVIKQQ